MRRLAMGACLLWAGCSALVEGRLPRDDANGEDGGMDGAAGEGGADASGRGADADEGGTGPQGGTGPEGGTGRSDSGDGTGADGAGADAGPDGPTARQKLKSCASKHHGCVLDAEGWLQCIGTEEQNGSLDVPEGKYQAVACGDAHTCGVFDDGDVQCWGSNSSGQRVARTAAQGGRHFVQVAAGAEHSCALDDEGYVTCWGGNDFGQATPPPDVRFNALAASGNYTCGVREADSIAQCWGFSSGNRLNTPKDQAFTALSLEDDYGCGLRADRTVRCWGAVAFAGEPGVEGDLLITNRELVCALDDEYLDCNPHSLAADDLYFELRVDPWAHVFGGYTHTCVVPDTGPMVCHTLNVGLATALDSEVGLVLPKPE